MALDGALRYEQRLGDLCVAEALANQLEYLCLAVMAPVPCRHLGLCHPANGRPVRVLTGARRGLRTGSVVVSVPGTDSKHGLAAQPVIRDRSAKELEVHPGMAEQLTVQRIREMNWRDRQLASGVVTRRPTTRGVARRWLHTRLDRWHGQPLATVVPLARREA